jgi:hypothetical protein
MYAIGPNIETEEERRRKMMAALPVVGGEVPVTVDASGQPEIDPRPLPEIPAQQPIDVAGILKAEDDAAKDPPPIVGRYIDANGNERYPMDERGPSGQTVGEMVNSLPPITNPYATKDTQAQVAGTLIPDTKTDNLPVIGDPIERELAAKNAELIDKSQYKDKHWTKWDKALAAVDGWAKGGILGAIGAVRDPHHFERERIEQARADLLPQIGALTHIRDANVNTAAKRAQIENLVRDNNRLDRQERNTDEWRRTETARKADTSRLTAVAGMLKNLPEFIPGDPRFAEMEKALGDVSLPVTRKDAKKKVDLKQDQRTGAWTVILTNPLNGQQETRDVLKDGKPFASTPTVVMQGEYGMLKQNDQQDFTASENAKNRSALETYRGAVLGLKQQELQLRQSGDARGADALKLKQDALKAKARERVKAGQLTQEDYDNIFREYADDSDLGAGASITR